MNDKVKRKKPNGKKNSCFWLCHTKTPKISFAIVLGLHKISLTLQVKIQWITMDNKKLIDKISTNLGRSKEDVSKLLEAFAGVLRERCSEMDSVQVPGFGTFEPKKRDERVMVQPSTGKRMLVPPKVVVGFKISNVLKAKLK